MSLLLKLLAASSNVLHEREDRAKEKRKGRAICSRLSQNTADVDP